MDTCDQPSLLNYRAFNYCIENDDWRPSQELLLTRFAPVEHFDMFRTINQDYGSFYHRDPTATCIPDTLAEKVHRRQERFINWALEQKSYRQGQSTLFPQENIDTVKITHRKKFSACHRDEAIIDFLVQQIHHQLKDLIDPSDYPDVFNCARVLIKELLSKEPSMCADDVISRVIGIMNTPFCCVNTNSNIAAHNGSPSTVQNPSKMFTNACHPVTPPSSSLLPFTNPAFRC